MTAPGTELVPSNNAPAYWIARVLFPDYFEQGAAEIVIESPLRWALEALAVIPSAISVSQAGVDPNVREVQQRANMLTPNALPSPSDLVSMELREVFRDQDRAAQLSPPPSETYIALMARHGFSRYHAESYWAAHWALPSITQGFEMYHRLRPGRVPDSIVFDEAALRELLRKQDVLPAYHDQIVATSYEPLTRVDVRRMFKLGVLTKSQVVEAYEDLGYDQVNAAFLADFTEADIRIEEKELSRGDWLAAYRLDLVTEEEFRAALLEMRYTTEGAEFVIMLENARKDREVQQAQEARDAKLKAMGRRVRRLSRAGTLDAEEWRAELEDLDLTDTQIDQFFAQYRLPARPAAKDLSRADQLAAFRYGIIPEDELRAALLSSGLDANEATRLIQIEKAKMAGRTKQNRELSKSDIISLLKKGIFTQEEAGQRLVDIGYSPQDAAALVIANTPAG